VSVVVVIDLGYGAYGGELHILVEHQLVLTGYFPHDIMDPLIVTTLLGISHNGVADGDAVGVSIAVRHQGGLSDERDWGGVLLPLIRDGLEKHNEEAGDDREKKHEACDLHIPPVQPKVLHQEELEVHRELLAPFSSDQLGAISS